MSDLHNKVGRKSQVSRKNEFSRRWIAIPLILLMGLSVSAQAPKTGFTRLLADVKFPQDDKPACLQFALENGDLKTGPLDGDYEGDAQLRCARALPHRGRATDYCSRRSLDRYGGNG